MFDQVGARMTIQTMFSPGLKKDNKMKVKNQSFLYNSYLVLAHTYLSRDIFLATERDILG